MEVGYPQKGQPVLTGAEEITGAAKPQILLCDPEAVVGAAKSL